MVMHEEATLQPMEKELEPRRAARRRSQGGFTLIEMLAVVVILAIVAGVGFVVVNNQIERARTNTDAANLRTIGDAANRYIMDNGSDKATDLKGNVDSNSKLIGNYLGAPPTDPWGTTGTYSISVDTTGRKITITSPHTPSGGTAQSIAINY